MVGKLMVVDDGHVLLMKLLVMLMKWNRFDRMMYDAAAAAVEAHCQR